MATTAAVAIVSKINVGATDKELPQQSDIWANRTKCFKKIKQELEEMCVAKCVKYMPSELNEVDHRTRYRRRKLKDLCDPSEKKT